MDDLFDGIPNELWELIKKELCDIDWVSLCMSYKRLWISFTMEPIPPWILWDEAYVKRDFPEYWNSFLNQMKLVGWPKKQPMYVRANKQKMTLQWRSPERLVNETKTYSIECCAVYFTVRQVYKGDWHVCNNMKDINGANSCGCKSTRKRTTHITLNSLMGRMIGSSSFSCRGHNIKIKKE